MSGAWLPVPPPGHRHLEVAGQVLTRASLCPTDQNSSTQSGDHGDDGDDSPDDRSQDGIDEEHNPNRHPNQPPGQQADAPGEAAVNRLSPQRNQRSQGSQRILRHANPSQSTPCGGSERADRHLRTTLPPYIRRLPRHIGQRDIDYLIEKDAFTIPDQEFRDELLRTYVKIIHCYMPAINLDELLVPIIRADGHEPVSLLLFQAVMFASVIFVDCALLRSRGYVSRKAARKVFFNRVRLLYGLDCEPDRLALIQALLLMTYWYDSPDDEKDTWYWMGITLSLSQVLGIHRDPDTLNISLREKRLRRRIWWSCYIRDRLLALGIRRPARIRQEEFNVPMLELDDFDLGQPAPERIAFMRGCGATNPEAHSQRAMCQVCIELAKLCVCIGNILHSQYSVVSSQPLSSEYYKNVAVLPRDPHEQTSELAKCDAELEDWYRNQKTTCRYSPPSPSPASDSAENSSGDCADKTAWLHQALLRMIYLTAVGALHRPRALGPSSSAPDSPENSSAKEASTRKVKEAAIAMTGLAFDLQSQNYLRFLSTSSVPAFLSATLVHLLDVRDGSEEVRSLAIGRFYQCLHVLYELHDMYASAGYAMRFLGTVLERMDASIPMLTTLRFCARAMMDGTEHPASLDAHRAPRISPYENYNIPLAGPNLDTPPSTSNQLTSTAPAVAPTPGNTDCIPGGPRAALGADWAAHVENGPQTHPSTNSLMDSISHMDIWNGIDGLLPAQINFGTDPHTVAPDFDTIVSNTSWQFYT